MQFRISSSGYYIDNLPGALANRFPLRAHAVHDCWPYPPGYYYPQRRAARTRRRARAHCVPRCHQHRCFCVHSLGDIAPRTGLQSWFGYGRHGAGRVRLRNHAGTSASSYHSPGCHILPVLDIKLLLNIHSLLMAFETPPGDLWKGGRTWDLAVRTTALTPIPILFEPLHTSIPIRRCTMLANSGRRRRHGGRANLPAGRALVCLFGKGNYHAHNTTGRFRAFILAGDVLSSIMPKLNRLLPPYQRSPNTWTLPSSLGHGRRKRLWLGCADRRSTLAGGAEQSQWLLLCHDSYWTQMPERRQSKKRKEAEGRKAETGYAWRNAALPPHWTTAWVTPNYLPDLY